VIANIYASGEVLFAKAAKLGRVGDHSTIRDIHVIRDSRASEFFGVTNLQILRSTWMNGQK
jgi:hypothetical protein